MGAFQDITGQQFGRWTVIAFYGMGKFHGSRWTCRCRCGTDRIIAAASLKQGRTKSCGCLGGEQSRARFLIDLTGLTFGRWKVIAPNTAKKGLARWDCLCECRNTATVFSAALRTGMSKSCGCLKIEFAGTHSVTHGMTDSHEYAIWSGAKARCFNPNSDRYSNYGGRGITMSEEWLNSFEQFFADMGPCPDGMELDRIDNDGNYEKGNCHWTDRKTNMRNRQDALRFTHNGLTLPLKEWSERTGIRYETLIYRMRRNLPLFAPIGPTSHRRNI